jgi:hypothetical protein
LAHRAAAAVAALFVTLGCDAATLAVEISDHDGAPVADVVVYVVPQDAPPPALPDPPPHAVVDQLDLEFVPHILVVRSGTVVEFPNSDRVNHHVYSFSPAKAFELPLYKGSIYPPVTFADTGIVTLGCNIHDGMLGYVFVVSTPWFAKTDGAGRARLASLPEGRYLVHVWTPRIGRRDLPAGQEIAVAAEGDAAVSFRFESPLHPPHGEQSSLQWSAY